FAQFLEFFLGGFVAGIFVGMILEGQLAIGLFDFLLAGAAVHPENIVIIAFGHGGQTAGFLATTTLAGRIRRARNLSRLANCRSTWPSGTSAVSCCERA